MPIAVTRVNATHSSYSISGKTVTFTVGSAASAFTDTYKISATYNGYTYSTDVSVNLQPTVVTLTSISVFKKPTKTTFYINETIDTTGLTLTATYSDGSTKTITSGFTASPQSFASTGTKTVTVTYQGKTVSFTVTIVDPDLDRIEVKTLPAKTVYRVGEGFDQTGLTLTAHYTDGSTRTITSGIICTGFSSATDGVKTITVNYGGKTTMFTVTVKRFDDFLVTYDANGGSGAPSSQKSDGNTITLTTAKPTRQGYDFRGWSEDMLAKEPTYLPGQTYTINGNMLLYAVWEKRAALPTIKIRTPSRTEIRYGDTLVLHADVENLPEGATVKWSVEDSNQISIESQGDPCTVSGHGDNCHTCKIGGLGRRATSVTCTICDASGNPMLFDGKEVSASIAIRSRYNIFMFLFMFIYTWFTKDYAY